jgi:hypothetical protein
MIEDVGELRITDANEANIPVDVWLHSPADNKDNGAEYDGEQDNGEDLWLLTANNYMPRRARLGEEWCYKVWGTKEELQALIKKHILPLYQVAVKYLQGMIDGKVDGEGKPVFGGLYYWELPESERVVS